MPQTDTARTTTAKVVAEIFAVVAFYLYFGGWVYASAMLGEFGLSLSVVDIPAYFFIVYAYSVFFTSCLGWLLLIGIGATWYLLSRYRLVPWAEILFAIGIATIPFPLVRVLSESRAIDDAAYLRIKAKTVRYYLIADASTTYPKSIIDIAESGKLRLILHAKEHSYAILQPPGTKLSDGTTVLPAAILYDLPTKHFGITIQLHDAWRK